MTNYDYYALTDIGKVRESNEDNAFYEKNAFGEILLLLLDGMGGHKKGDVASKLSIDFIKREFEHRKAPFKSLQEQKKWFQKTLKEANKYIFNIANSSIESKGMGTTLVGVLISHDHTLVANIGDSRCYICKDNKLKQITKDDTYANFLLDNGKITKEEYEKYDKKNVLTNAVGAYENLEVKIESIANYSKILLCSDGLYNFVKFDAMEQVLNMSLPLKMKCQKLINMANDAGGKDNIGVLICEVNN